jgi:hypothetical protein
MRAITSGVCLVLAAALVGFLAWQTYDIIGEAYGPGPPYYGRTTSMDKWTDPMPGLAAVDLVGLGIAGALLYVGLRSRRRAGR